MAAPLITCQSISKSFGLVPVFKDVNLTFGDGDRVGIIGPNGAGKSTLLKILAGQEQPDTGLVTAKRGLKIAYVSQVDTFTDSKTIREVLLESTGALNLRSDLGRVEAILGKARFPDPDALVKTLSGGWKKRLAICEKLLEEPELLLLDEPTNHLDLEGIHWLEDILENPAFAFAVISHDRYFLESSCTKIIEINQIYPGGNFVVEGGYGEYMRRKAEFIDGHASHMAGLANKLRRETEWLRQGAQARSTKQQARIKSAETLKGEVEQATQRARRQAVEFQFSPSHRKTRKLIEAKDLRKMFGSRIILKNLSFVLGPGVRLGLTGPNGSGKTTLLKILQSEVNPDEGSVTTADQLKVVYYDQHRETLPEQISLRRALAEDSDYVQIQDRKIHVAGYAKTFGFRTEQLETPVSRLSGGERARLLLARLLQRSADVLILDEPTNDLDIDTLEVLEDNLLEFPGAVVLVTHDRYLMDRVSTGILGLEKSGDHGFFADYAQYLSHQRSREKSRTREGENKSQNPTFQAQASQVTSTQQEASQQQQAIPKRSGSKKLTYMEQREWDSMESNILEAEQKLADAQAKTQDPAIASSAMKLQEACKAVDIAQANVDRLYARWAELESKTRD